MKKKMKKIGDNAYHYGLQLCAVGSLTGLFAGAATTLYNVLTSESEHFSQHVYGLLRENPAFIPLLFLVLIAGAIIVGGVLKFIPMIRGSGIPQTEGATRGLIRFKWYQVLTGMFATSLFTVFLGLSAGSEGPSITIGGASGYGVSELLRRNETIRRYQVTGGACAGLAVAFNAPFTGMAFAFEEAHKRFTTEVFVCSFSSVIVGVLTRNLLRSLMGLPIGAFLTTYTFTTPNMLSYLYILLAAAVCGIAGVGFYYLVFFAKKLFAKITFFKGIGKMIIPFVLGGAFGLITVNAMGGGHELLQSLGGGMANVEAVFSSPLWATLLIVFALKFIISIVNMGAGVPCGVFVPMLAVGACLGGLMSLLCMQMGMDPAYSDLIVMICMAAFFTTIVKAPLTAIIMVVELTWNFSFLLPVIVGVAIGYIAGEIFHTEPIYDKLLDGILEEQRKLHPVKKVSVKLRVLAGTPVDGRSVRNVLWPHDTLVTSLWRGETHIVPDGETVMRAGDVIDVIGEAIEGKELTKTLTSIVGETLEWKEEEIVETKPASEQTEQA